MRTRWLACLALAVVALAPGVRAADEDPNVPVDPARYDHVVKVACVGASITEGVGTSRRRVTSWPGDLGRMLGAKWDVGNFGQGGRTVLNHGDTPYQTKGPLQSALTFEPDVVVILLGTNDSKPWNWAHKDEFVGDYRDLIRKFRALPTHPRVFACSVPFVAGAGNYGIKEENVRAECPMVAAAAAAEGAGFIDVHAATVGRADLLSDRVHPNDRGAELIARVVYKALTGEAFAGEVPPPPPPATKAATTRPATN